MIESRISRTNLFNTVFQKTSITSEIKILAEPIKRIIQFQSSGPAKVVKIILISILQGWIFLFSNPFHIIPIHVQMQSRFQCFTFMKGMLMIQVKTSYITGWFIIHKRFICFSLFILGQNSPTLLFTFRRIMVIDGTHSQIIFGRTNPVTVQSHIRITYIRTFFTDSGFLIPRILLYRIPLRIIMMKIEMRSIQA